MVVRGLAKHSSCSRNRGGGGSPAAQVADRDRSGWVARGQQNVHWYHSTQAAWLHCPSDDIKWTGWSAESASPVAMPLSDWQPWTAVSDETAAPFVRWYCGARTNAAFNEIDVHILQVSQRLEPSDRQGAAVVLTAPVIVRMLAGASRQDGFHLRSPRAAASVCGAAAAATALDAVRQRSGRGDGAQHDRPTRHLHAQPPRGVCVPVQSRTELLNAFPFGLYACIVIAAAAAAVATVANLPPPPVHSA